MDRIEILQRFERWLDTAMAEDAPPQGIPPEILASAGAAQETTPTDWYTMWAAITALTQEVKLQGRAFKQLMGRLGAQLRKRTCSHRCREFHSDLFGFGERLELRTLAWPTGKESAAFADRLLKKVF